MPHLMCHINRAWESASHPIRVPRWMFFEGSAWTSNSTCMVHCQLECCTCRWFKTQPATTSPGAVLGLSAHWRNSAMCSSKLLLEKTTFLPAHDFHAMMGFSSLHQQKSTWSSLLLSDSIVVVSAMSLRIVILWCFCVSLVVLFSSGQSWISTRMR